MPLINTGCAPDSILDVLPYDCVPVAVEINERAVQLPRYKHPEALKACATLAGSRGRHSPTAKNPRATFIGRYPASLGSYSSIWFSLAIALLMPRRCWLFGFSSHLRYSSQTSAFASSSSLHSY